MKRQATFGAAYFMGTALPAGFSCCCCGRDKRGQDWANCADLTRRYGIPHALAHERTCRRYHDEAMPLCARCWADLRADLAKEGLP